MARQKYSNKLLMVCPAAIKDYANAAAEQTMGAGNGQTFLVGFSATGSAPATHYICHSPMTASFVATLVGLATTFPAIEAWVSGDADFSALAAFANAHVVDDVVAMDIISSLGLKQIS